MKDNFTDEELVNEIRKRGLFDDDGLIKGLIYQIGVDTLPIICTDVIPVKKDGGVNKIGVILRATGPEAGKLAITGGRIKRDQKVSDAISRHLKNDLATSDWKFHPANTEQRPFYVQQYFQNSTYEKGYGYDPTKHAISLTYVIEITGDPIPKNEATKFLWISERELTANTAYNHGEVMKQAFKYL